MFTGGIGENGVTIRTAICADLTELGIELNASLNATGQGERRVSAATSRTQIWVIPTNEELIVARLTRQHLEG